MQYELMIVLRPDLTEEELKFKIEEVKKLVTDGGGEVVGENAWGERALAYSINHFEEGVYHFFELELDPSQVKDLEKKLNLADDLLRFLIVR